MFLVVFFFNELILSDLNLGESPDEKVISKLDNLDFHKCGPTNHDRYRRYKMMYKSDQSKFHSQQRVWVLLKNVLFYILQKNILASFTLVLSSKFA